jgi:restriction system protein
VIERNDSGLPTAAQFMWPALQALKQLGGTGGVNDVLDGVVSSEGLSLRHQSEMLPRRNETELHHRMRWSLWMLMRRGAVQRLADGMYTATELGRGIDRDGLSRLSASVFAVWDGPVADASEAVASDEPVVRLDAVISADPPWQVKLLSALQSMQPAAFERLFSLVLRGSGFTKVEVTGRSGDGGIDGSGVLRIADLLSFQVLFQCKRYKGVVGSQEIRNFRGAMVGRSDKGLFITTGAFTSDARREASRDGAPPIDLIDGEQLCELLKKRGIGVRTELVERVEIDTAFFESV